jgi:hypothetical protein
VALSAKGGGADAVKTNANGASVSVVVGCLREFSSKIVLGAEGGAVLPFAKKEEGDDAKKVTHSFSFFSPSVALVLGYNTRAGLIFLTAGAATLGYETEMPSGTGTEKTTVTLHGVAPAFGACYEYPVLKHIGIRVGGSYAFGTKFLERKNGGKEADNISADCASVSLSVIYHI